MTLWDALDRAGERRQARALARINDRRLLANVIGAALISGFLGALAALFVIPIPKGNEQIVTYMIGQLSGFAGGIVAYHYASKAVEALDTAARVELDTKRAETTGKLVDVATAALAATPGIDGSAAQAAQKTADAAQNEADRIGG